MDYASPERDRHKAYDSIQNASPPLQHKNIRNICCLGAGYVGGPTCAVTANKCPDIEVTVVDFNVERIKAWHTNNLPIYEPGLLEVLQPARDGIPGYREPNLFFSTDVKAAITRADLIFLCVPTPTKITGTGAGSAADMVYVEAAARMIAEAAEDDKIVVEKSTVPCRTADDIRKTFNAVGRPRVHFDILSNPEFLAEGTAINDLLEPDRILIGSLHTPRGIAAANALADVYGRWVPRHRLITMNLWSSEMAKLSANALLAQRISSINALSAVCEATGADVDEVSYACGLDSRIGSRMLKSSVGFGGSCFKKDVLNLVYIADSHHLPEVAAYWKGIIDINEYQKDRFIKRIVKCLFSTLTNKKVAILGYAYKKDTGDTRESAAISIVNHLLAESADVTIYDPKVKDSQIWQSLVETNHERMYNTVVRKRVALCKTSYEACEDADAVVIATEWDEFSNKDPGPRKPQASPHGTSHTYDPIPEARSGSTSSTEPTASSTSSSIENTVASLASSLANTALTTPLTNPTSPNPDTKHSHTETAAAIQEELAKYSLTEERKISYPELQLSSELRRIVDYPTVLAAGTEVEAEKNVPSDRNLPKPKMDWSHIARVMRRPMFVFDGRNIVDAEKLRRLGFSVEGIGKPGVGVDGSGIM